MVLSFILSICLTLLSYLVSEFSKNYICIPSCGWKCIDGNILWSGIKIATCIDIITFPFVTTYISSLLNIYPLIVENLRWNWHSYILSYLYYVDSCWYADKDKQNVAYYWHRTSMINHLNQHLIYGTLRIKILAYNMW